MYFIISVNGLCMSSIYFIHWVVKIKNSFWSKLHYHTFVFLYPPQLGGKFCLWNVGQDNNENVSQHKCWLMATNQRFSSNYCLPLIVIKPIYLISSETREPLLDGWWSCRCTASVLTLRMHKYVLVGNLWDRGFIFGLCPSKCVLRGRAHAYMVMRVRLFCNRKKNSQNFFIITLMNILRLVI